MQTTQSEICLATCSFGVGSLLGVAAGKELVLSQVPHLVGRAADQHLFVKDHRSLDFGERDCHAQGR